MRILEASRPKEIKQIMQDIHVDAYGIKIMLPKAMTHLVRINSISNISANILKQEMLSLGGDVAIARDALTGKVKKTDCLLMGNFSQFNRLDQKLNKQPFGLGELAKDLSRTLDNYQRDRFILEFGKYKLNLSERTSVMGILNITPDSFSGDGLYNSSLDNICEVAERMAGDGADIIDVGGESSRPGAHALGIREESSRVIPLIKILAKKIKVPISIDTYKPDVAKKALDCGAVIVNDITGLRNQKMAKLIAKYKAGVIIMHMKGSPLTMQKKPEYRSLIGEITEHLDEAIKRAAYFGISKDRMIIDPGIGFGKTHAHNLEILKRLNEFKILGLPILVGTSRKSFLGRILNVRPEERIFGTVSSCILAVKNGAKMVRVHDVRQVKQALKVFDSINNA